MHKKIFAAAFALGLFVSPFFAHGASFSYEAWIPFWRKEAGAGEISLRLPRFASVSPFSYEVNADGTLKDSLKIEAGFWADWFQVARGVKTKIVPTVAWLNGDEIHALLSNTTLRRLHATLITDMVKSKKFDGVDIDYEDKSSKTKPYFSLFIEGLSGKLHAAKKTLSCTIEGRTPVESRFAVVPTDLAYANDYKVLNKYCDEVRIMAYDQGSIDLDLNAVKGASGLYMPVADPDWVEKVVKEALKTIPAKKVVLGVPTYGYQYEVSVGATSTMYKRLAATTFAKATELAKNVGAVPARNTAGEMSFLYATSTSQNVSRGLTYFMPATSSLPALTSAAGGTVLRFVNFSDAAAMNDKIELAKKYKLKGVVFFKFDGETDPALWDKVK